MYEKLEECPLCGFSSHSNHIIVDDHSHSKESFAIVQCQKCLLLYTNPRPDKEAIGAYYENENYISHTDNSNNLTNLIYKVARHFTLNWKKRLITNYSTEKRMLDYGCGTGDVLAHMKQSNWETTGVEPSESARNKAISKGLTVYPELTKDLKEKYNVITAWHVVEHIHDLIDTIRALRKLLKDDGKLLIAVPNCASYDAQHYQAYWAGYDVPRHLYHFTPETMQALATKTKMKIQETIPMKLDAFYVSLLSEKYIGNKLAMLRGFKTGLKSNQKAKQTGNYSSLIYVLTK
ncbi:MAG: class I SAM-dependent methyltransferase [Cytophagales bacterium]|nr:class I SAM-dependent methyltransferase [Cytophagales bacterium]